MLLLAFFCSYTKAIAGEQLLSPAYSLIFFIAAGDFKPTIAENSCSTTQLLLSP